MDMGVMGTALVVVVAVLCVAIVAGYVVLRVLGGRATDSDHPGGVADRGGLDGNEG